MTRCSTPRPLAGLCGALLLAACSPATSPRTAEAQVRVQDVRESLAVLAADSLQGRATGTPGADRAARFIAARLRAYGVLPVPGAAGAGDSAYLQPIPVALAPRANGQLRPTLLSSWAALDTVPAARRLRAANVVGMIPGSDARLREEAVVIAAHYDHLGVGEPVNGDSIYNGADDDASGVVAVLEVARALAKTPPRRTVVILLTTGEEVGLLGTRWYMEHPAVPLARTVAELEVEMIGRPDPLVGGAGKAWLTGYERSSMGAALAAAGVPIVADPRPAEQFFVRSDNIAFACRGIPAHTLSSFGLHRDYHTPDDEVERIDFAHATQVVEAAVRAARILTDGEAPRWVQGGKPEGGVCGRF